ncbi:hypothetical protein LTR56_006276 [Elasticomyces elasticus]|nr:hypothetical protein LTR56_006276 [Elasticomyces elasticus]KAK3666515.1 hypothetical protein LTR22_002459 [Elasticomyces elasticus]KAK4928352.1 hypothetical protein LTR49_005029 [Elasticomyces elasticus]KAK5763915.1 hypothetical protein LTS12_006033 [Elasticomyces elasticus]
MTQAPLTTSNVDPANFPNPQTVQLHFQSDSMFTPYESNIDIRIPNHFANQDHVLGCYTKDGRVTEVIRQPVGLATARYLGSKTGKMASNGPLFFTISATKKTVRYWRNVHTVIRSLLVEPFRQRNEPMFEHPPVMWLLELGAVML